jgi:hypothetical protein
MRFQMYKGFKRDLFILIGLIILLLIFKTIGG